MKPFSIIFSHGQESGPWGTKIRVMADRVRDLGHFADSVDYQGMPDPGERVEKLVEYCASLNDDIVLVGSSMGGHVATAAADRVGAVGLFVLAPAYYIPEFEAETPAPPAMPLTIVHGWHDDIVPVANSIRYAEECNATLIVVDGDHRLTENIDDINDYLALFLQRLGGGEGS